MSGPVSQRQVLLIWLPRDGSIWGIWTELNASAVVAFCEIGEE